MSSPNDFSDSELADAYIIANGMSGADSCFWAVEEMVSLPYADPERAWRVILAVTERAPPDWVLAILGAGPLEDLLRAHGLDFIDRVEQEAVRNQTFFANVLACVYPIACQPAPVGDRIKALYGKNDIPPA